MIIIKSLKGASQCAMVQKYYSVATPNIYGTDTFLVARNIPASGASKKEKKSLHHVLLYFLYKSRAGE